LADKLIIIILSIVVSLPFIADVARNDIASALVQVEVRRGPLF
jgi:hypothetical protein